MVRQTTTLRKNHHWRFHRVIAQRTHIKLFHQFTAGALALVGGSAISAALAAAPDAATATPSPTLQVNVAPGYEAIAAKLAAFIQAEQKAKELPAISIAIVDGDQIVYAGGFGVKRAADKSLADRHTVYRVGSVSKLFNDVAVMQFVEQGKIDLDAPVTSYLPDFKPENSFAKQPTVRHLMNHQSGLIRESPVGNYFDPDEPSIADTVASLNQTKLVDEPGAKTKYSNTAVSAAGLIVERLAGKPFAEHVKTTLLTPMGMESSDFLVAGAPAEHIPDAWMWTPHLARFAAPTFDLGTLPAGNLYASVDDLGNFLITLFNGGKFDGKQIITPETLAAMLKPVGAGEEAQPLYGVGFRLGEFEGHPTFGHNGAVYGYSTNLIGLPNEKIGVATVCALDGSGGFVKRLTEYALRLMLAKKEGKPLPEIDLTTPLPPGKSHQLAGLYTNGDRTLKLQADGNRLLLNHDYLISEVRALGDRLIVDDPHTYGPEIQVKDDGNVLVINKETWTRQPSPQPAAPSEKWQGLIGEYGWDHNILYIYEDRGQLWALIEWFYNYPLTEVSENVFAFPNAGLYPAEQIVFKRGADGVATEAVAADVTFKRRNFGDFPGGVFQIRPTRPIETLRAEALAASPPNEARPFRPVDLVEPSELDPTIKLDVRYASDRNFTGTKIYDSAQSFLQRPAAESLVRVNKALKEKGYGLLIHDAYRPWYVTKIFWDATPDHLHGFVANPEEGSRHNRGCAVDLTLYDLKTGEPIEMVGVYDEMSPRSFPLYPGGTSLQRYHRDLLRDAMEKEGFTVYPVEWWHFDYKDWKQYPIVNKRFEELSPAR
jgi:CubicO group peptidase (beta-lactamase class C family)/D-alanyl-D-alanine dipeptidase